MLSMQPDSDRPRRNGFKTKEGRFKLDIRRKVSPRGSKAVALLPRAEGSPSLEVPEDMDGLWAARAGGAPSLQQGWGCAVPSNPTVL